MLPLQAQSITQTYTHHILSGSHFYGWVNQSPHDSDAAREPQSRNHDPLAKNPTLLTNCAIITNQKQMCMHPNTWLGHQSKDTANKAGVLYQWRTSIMTNEVLCKSDWTAWFYARKNDLPSEKKTTKNTCPTMVFSGLREFLMSMPACWTHRLIIFSTIRSILFLWRCWTLNKR